MSTHPPAPPAPALDQSSVRARLNHVIFVDDEEDILFIARGIFAAQLPSIHLETFSDPHAALEALRAEPPDLLITDLWMSGISGIELIWQAREIRPSLPVVLVSAFGTAGLREEIARKRSMVFVDKPFTAATLRAAMTRAAADAWAEELGLEDEAAPPGTIDLIQLYALAGATGRLDLAHSSGEAKIWLEHGTIVHAERGQAVGEAAVCAVVEWVGGSPLFHLGETAPRATVRAGWQQALLESCRLLDESHRLDTEPVVEAPAGKPADVETTAAEMPQQKGRQAMANVKETLHKLSEVDGFVGSCVVDSNSGMMLGAEGGGSVNLEVAAAGNTEVVRAKRKTMIALGLKDAIEDILITLGKQYHLIRPLSSKDGLFIYLVLDKSRGNLAMARHQLAAAEGDLVF